VQIETLATLEKLADPQEGGTQVVSGRSDDGARGVAWSPNGSILFTSSRSGKTEIWAVQPNGAGLRQLTESSGWSPAASKDGHWYVFIDGRRQLWRAAFDDSSPTILTAATKVFHPIIDSNGWVHYESVVHNQPKSYRIPIAGGAPVETTTGGWFSPSDTRGNGELLGCNWDEKQSSYFAAMRVDGAEAVRVLKHVVISPPRCPSLKFTPDGALSFIKIQDGRMEIWRHTIEPSPAVQLTRSGGDDIFAYAWSPEG
jgi:WD40 repeat protein